ncbi:hypothetical protein HK102_005290, partial [Quaeritorhiza haematococci]
IDAPSTSALKVSTSRRLSTSSSSSETSSSHSPTSEKPHSRTTTTTRSLSRRPTYPDLAGRASTKKASPTGAAPAATSRANTASKATTTKSTGTTKSAGPPVIRPRTSSLALNAAAKSASSTSSTVTSSPASDKHAKQNTKPETALPTPAPSAPSSPPPRRSSIPTTNDNLPPTPPPEPTVSKAELPAPVEAEQITSKEKTKEITVEGDGKDAEGMIVVSEVLVEEPTSEVIVVEEKKGIEDGATEAVVAVSVSVEESTLETPVENVEAVVVEEEESREVDSVSAPDTKDMISAVTPVENVTVSVVEEESTKEVDAVSAVETNDVVEVEAMNQTVEAMSIVEDVKQEGKVEETRVVEVETSAKLVEEPVSIVQSEVIQVTFERTEVMQQPQSEDNSRKADIVAGGDVTVEAQAGAEIQREDESKPTETSEEAQPTPATQGEEKHVVEESQEVVEETHIETVVESTTKTTTSITVTTDLKSVENVSVETEVVPVEHEEITAEKTDETAPVIVATSEEQPQSAAPTELIAPTVSEELETVAQTEQTSEPIVTEASQPEPAPAAEVIAPTTSEALDTVASTEQASEHIVAETLQQPIVEEEKQKVEGTSAVVEVDRTVPDEVQKADGSRSVVEGPVETRKIESQNTITPGPLPASQPPQPAPAPEPKLLKKKSSGGLSFFRNISSFFSSSSASASEGVKEVEGVSEAAKVDAVKVEVVKVQVEQVEQVQATPLEVKAENPVKIEVEVTPTPHLPSAPSEKVESVVPDHITHNEQPEQETISAKFTESTTLLAHHLDVTTPTVTTSVLTKDLQPSEVEPEPSILDAVLAVISSSKAEVDVEKSVKDVGSVQVVEQKHDEVSRAPVDAAVTVVGVVDEVVEVQTPVLDATGQTDASEAQTEPVDTTQELVAVTDTAATAVELIEEKVTETIIVESKLAPNTSDLADQLLGEVEKRLLEGGDVSEETVSQSVEQTREESSVTTDQVETVTDQVNVEPSEVVVADAVIQEDVSVVSQVAAQLEAPASDDHVLVDFAPAAPPVTVEVETHEDLVEEVSHTEVTEKPQTTADAPVEEGVVEPVVADVVGDKKISQVKVSQVVGQHPNDVPALAAEEGIESAVVDVAVPEEPSKDEVEEVNEAVEVSEQAQVSASVDEVEVQSVVVDAVETSKDGVLEVSQAMEEPQLPPSVDEVHVELPQVDSAAKEETPKDEVSEFLQVAEQTHETVNASADHVKRSVEPVAVDVSGDKETSNDEALQVRDDPVDQLEVQTTVVDTVMNQVTLKDEVSDVADVAEQTQVSASESVDQVEVQTAQVDIPVQEEISEDVVSKVSLVEEQTQDVSTTVTIGDQAEAEGAVVEAPEKTDSAPIEVGEVTEQTQGGVTAPVEKVEVEIRDIFQTSSEMTDSAAAEPRVEKVDLERTVVEAAFDESNISNASNAVDEQVQEKASAPVEEGTTEPCVLETRDQINISNDAQQSEDVQRAVGDADEQNEASKDEVSQVTEEESQTASVKADATPAVVETGKSVQDEVESVVADTPENEEIAQAPELMRRDEVVKPTEPESVTEVQGDVVEPAEAASSHEPTTEAVEQAEPELATPNESESSSNTSEVASIVDQTATIEESTTSAESDAVSHPTKQTNDKPTNLIESDPSSSASHSVVDAADETGTSNHAVVGASLKGGDETAIVDAGVPQVEQIVGQEEVQVEEIVVDVATESEGSKEAIVEQAENETVAVDTVETESSARSTLVDTIQQDDVGSVVVDAAEETRVEGDAVHQAPEQNNQTAAESEPSSNATDVRTSADETHVECVMVDGSEDQLGTTVTDSEVEEKSQAEIDSTTEPQSSASVEKADAEPSIEVIQQSEISESHIAEPVPQIAETTEQQSHVSESEAEKPIEQLEAEPSVVEVEESTATEDVSEVVERTEEEVTSHIESESASQAEEVVSQANVQATVVDTAEEKEVLNDIIPQATEENADKSIEVEVSSGAVTLQQETDQTTEVAEAGDKLKETATTVESEVSTSALVVEDVVQEADIEPAVVETVEGTGVGSSAASEADVSNVEDGSAPVEAVKEQEVSKDEVVEQSHTDEVGQSTEEPEAETNAQTLDESAAPEEEVVAEHRTEGEQSDNTKALPVVDAQNDEHKEVISSEITESVTATAVEVSLADQVECSVESSATDKAKHLEVTLTVQEVTVSESIPQVDTIDKEEAMVEIPSHSETDATHAESRADSPKEEQLGSSEERVVEITTVVNEVNSQTIPVERAAQEGTDVDEELVSGDKATTVSVEQDVIADMQSNVVDIEENDKEVEIPETTAAIGVVKDEQTSTVLEVSEERTEGEVVQINAEPDTTVETMVEEKAGEVVVVRDEKSAQISVSNGFEVVEQILETSQVQTEVIKSSVDPATADRSETTVLPVPEQVDMSRNDSKMEMEAVADAVESNQMTEEAHSAATENVVVVNETADIVAVDEQPALKVNATVEEDVVVELMVEKELQHDDFESLVEDVPEFTISLSDLSVADSSPHASSDVQSQTPPTMQEIVHDEQDQTVDVAKSVSDPEEKIESEQPSGRETTDESAQMLPALVTTKLPLDGGVQKSALTSALKAQKSNENLAASAMDGTLTTKPESFASPKTTEETFTIEERPHTPSQSSTGLSESVGSPDTWIKSPSRTGMAPVLSRFATSPPPRSASPITFATSVANSTPVNSPPRMRNLSYDLDGAASPRRASGEKILPQLEKDLDRTYQQTARWPSVSNLINRFDLRRQSGSPDSSASGSSGDELKKAESKDIPSDAQLRFASRKSSLLPNKNMGDTAARSSSSTTPDFTITTVSSITSSPQVSPTDTIPSSSAPSSTPQSPEQSPTKQVGTVKAKSDTRTVHFEDTIETKKATAPSFINRWKSFIGFSSTSPEPAGSSGRVKAVAQSLTEKRSDAVSVEPSFLKRQQSLEKLKRGTVTQVAQKLEHVASTLQSEVTLPPKRPTEAKAQSSSSSTVSSFMSTTKTRQIQPEGRKFEAERLSQSELQDSNVSSTVMATPPQETSNEPHVVAIQHSQSAQVTLSEEQRAQAENQGLELEAGKRDTSEILHDKPEVVSLSDNPLPNDEAPKEQSVAVPKEIPSLPEAPEGEEHEACSSSIEDHVAPQNPIQQQESFNEKEYQYAEAVQPEVKTDTSIVPEPVQPQEETEAAVPVAMEEQVASSEFQEEQESPPAARTREPVQIENEEDVSAHSTSDLVLDNEKEYVSVPLIHMQHPSSEKSETALPVHQTPEDVIINELREETDNGSAQAPPESNIEAPMQPRLSMHPKEFARSSSPDDFSDDDDFLSSPETDQLLSEAWGSQDDANTILDDSESVATSQGQPVSPEMTDGTTSSTGRKKRRRRRRRRGKRKKGNREIPEFTVDLKDLVAGLDGNKNNSTSAEASSSTSPSSSSQEVPEVAGSVKQPEQSRSNEASTTSAANTSQPVNRSPTMGMGNQPQQRNYGAPRDQQQDTGRHRFPQRHQQGQQQQRHQPVQHHQHWNGAESSRYDGRKYPEVPVSDESQDSSAKVRVHSEVEVGNVNGNERGEKVVAEVEFGISLGTTTVESQSSPSGSAESLATSSSTSPTMGPPTATPAATTTAATTTAAAAAAGNGESEVGAAGHWSWLGQEVDGARPEESNEDDDDDGVLSPIKRLSNVFSDSGNEYEGQIYDDAHNHMQPTQATPSFEDQGFQYEMEMGTAMDTEPSYEYDKEYDGEYEYDSDEYESDDHYEDDGAFESEYDSEADWKEAEEEVVPEFTVSLTDLFNKKETDSEAVVDGAAAVKLDQTAEESGHNTVAGKEHEGTASDDALKRATKSDPDAARAAQCDLPTTDLVCGPKSIEEDSGKLETSSSVNDPHRAVPTDAASGVSVEDAAPAEVGLGARSPVEAEPHLESSKPHIATSHDESPRAVIERKSGEEAPAIPETPRNEQLEKQLEIEPPQDSSRAVEEPESLANSKLQQVESKLEITARTPEATPEDEDPATSGQTKSVNSSMGGWFSQSLFRTALLRFAPPSANSSAKKDDSPADEGETRRESGTEETDPYRVPLPEASSNASPSAVHTQPSQVVAETAREPEQTTKTEESKEVEIESTSFAKSQEAVLRGKKSTRRFHSHTFVWPYGGSHVLVTGTFDDWSQSIVMKPQPDEDNEDLFVAVVDIPILDVDSDFDLPIVEGSDGRRRIVHSYKFVVDGTWSYDGAVAFKTDDQGNMNNLLEIPLQLPAVAHAGKASEDVPPEPELVADKTDKIETTMAKAYSSDEPESADSVPSVEVQAKASRQQEVTDPILAEPEARADTDTSKPILDASQSEPTPVITSPDNQEVLEQKSALVVSQHNVMDTVVDAVKVEAEPEVTDTAVKTDDNAIIEPRSTASEAVEGQKNTYTSAQLTIEYASGDPSSANVEPALSKVETRIEQPVQEISADKPAEGPSGDKTPKPNSNTDCPPSTAAPTTNRVHEESGIEAQTPMPAAPPSSLLSFMFETVSFRDGVLLTPENPDANPHKPSEDIVSRTDIASSSSSKDPMEMQKETTQSVLAAQNSSSVDNALLYCFLDTRSESDKEEQRNLLAQQTSAENEAQQMEAPTAANEVVADWKDVTLFQRTEIERTEESSLEKADHPGSNLDIPHGALVVEKSNIDSSKSEVQVSKSDESFIRTIDVTPKSDTSTKRASTPLTTVRDAVTFLVYFQLVSFILGIIRRFIEWSAKSAWRNILYMFSGILSTPSYSSRRVGRGRPQHHSTANWNRRKSVYVNSYSSGWTINVWLVGAMLMALVVVVFMVRRYRRTRARAPAVPVMART